MHHPGKVLKVFSPSNSNVISSDSNTQAMLSMWDENLITTGVHQSLESKIKEGDIVLVDYEPVSSTVPIPKLLITKILRGETATETWRAYGEKYTAMKGRTPLIHLQGSQPQQPPHSYIG